MFEAGESAEAKRERFGGGDMLSVSCGACGVSFFVPDESAGHEVKCGTCGRAVQVPKEEDKGSKGAGETVDGAWEYLMVLDRGRLGHMDQAKLNELGMQGGNW